MVKVDLHARRIEAGVRDLIASGAAGRARGGGGSSLRAMIGAEVHARYRERREHALGSRFEAERAVQLVLVVDGFTATVSGRIDGLIQDDAGRTIEEVKSVLERGQTDLPDARLQVATYALALAQADPASALTLRLVLISVDDDDERHVPVTFDAAQTQADLSALLRSAIAAARGAERKAEARARWAQGMVFPHEAMREGQAMLVQAIDDALIEHRPLLAEAPTGTGKTAAALFGALRFAARRGARVFYATPKTTQHAHVAATFEALCRDSATETNDDVPPPRAVSLHARSRLCATTGRACDRRTCPRLLTYADRAPAVVDALRRAHVYASAEVLRAAAQQHNLCAYELSFDLAQDADLVIGDYNYVFDPGIALLASSAVPTVVVIDEAHNLVDRARDYASARLTLRDVERAEHALAPTDPSANQLIAWLAEVRTMITQATAKTPTPDDGGGLLVYEGTFELSMLPLAIDSLAQRARLLLLRRLARAPNPFASEADEPDPVAEVMRTIIRSSDATAFANDTLVPYAFGATVHEGPGLGLICVDPARALTRRHREALGVVAMSATLGPADYWSDVLGLDALDPVRLRVPSPFSPEQRRVVIVQSVSTTYRDRRGSLPKLARLIAQVVAVQPGPYLVFFPSFAYLAAVRDQLPPMGQVLVQAPRTSLSERQALLDRFRNGQGARVLLAVTGGVFGEGIDLPGEQLLGAMVVGPSLPPIGFPRAAMARHYEATRQAGFAYAMLYPGLQRVVQAAGRVIRREDDRGVIVLFGRRFVAPDILDALPEDWYRYDPSELVPDDPIAALEAFWRPGR